MHDQRLQLVLLWLITLTVTALSRPHEPMTLRFSTASLQARSSTFNGSEWNDQSSAQDGAQLLSRSYNDLTPQAPNYDHRELYACSFKGERYSVEPYFLDAHPKLNDEGWKLLIALANQMDRAWYPKYLHKLRKVNNDFAELKLAPDDGSSSGGTTPKLPLIAAANCLEEFFQIAGRQGRTYEVIFHIIDGSDRKLALGSLLATEGAKSSEPSIVELAR